MKRVSPAITFIGLCLGLLSAEAQADPIIASSDSVKDDVGGPRLGRGRHSEPLYDPRQPYDGSSGQPYNERSSRRSEIQYGRDGHYPDPLTRAPDLFRHSDPLPGYNRRGLSRRFLHRPRFSRH